MAQQVQVTLLCDLDDGDVGADETLQFSLDNITYEVDVCAKHAQQIRDGLESFAEHARKVSGTGRRHQRTAKDRQETNAIRSWAKDHGLEVNARGRISASIIKEYQAAH